MKTKVEIEMEITPEIIDAIAEKLISSGDYFPVVRCKECRWHTGEYYCDNFNVYGFGNEDFCSLGEKKDNG